jgi:hypothetical protein
VLDKGGKFLLFFFLAGVSVEDFARVIDYNVDFKNIYIYVLFARRIGNLTEEWNEGSTDIRK